MVLDIFLFRKERGGDPDLLRESQRRRGKDPAAVDAVIEHDDRWRRLLVKVENKRRVKRVVTAACRERMARAPGGEPLPIPPDILAGIEDLTEERLGALNGPQLRALSKAIDASVAEDEAAQERAAAARAAALKRVGNVVHHTCRPVADEEQNEVVREWAPPDGMLPPPPAEVRNNFDLMTRLGGMDCGERATRCAGGRAYFLKGELVQLQLALINYAMAFLADPRRGYTPMYPPFFMNKDVMGDVAELADFDEALYHVGDGDGDAKYLIATSEQPICAYHRDKQFEPAELDRPIKYAGYSTCFRKEAGQRRDTHGIFRVHQFEKIEQFVVCKPGDGESWHHLNEMVATSQAFYESLGLPYRVVRIVAGALNLAAALKFDLEARFPAPTASAPDGTYRELVSCSNCTDYQARAINCRYGPSTRAATGDRIIRHPHMLNGTLCAVTRTMCCIVENYQTDEGIVVPEVLRPFMLGRQLMRFPEDCRTAGGAMTPPRTPPADAVQRAEDAVGGQRRKGGAKGRRGKGGADPAP